MRAKSDSSIALLLSHRFVSLRAAQATLLPCMADSGADISFFVEGLQKLHEPIRMPISYNSARKHCLDTQEKGKHFSRKHLKLSFDYGGDRH